MASTTSIVLQEKKVLNGIREGIISTRGLSTEDFISTSAAEVFQALKNLELEQIDFSISNIAIEVGKVNKNLDEERLKTLFSIDVKASESEYLLSSLKESRIKDEIQNNLLKNLLEETSSNADVDMDRLLDISDTLSKKLGELTAKPSDILTAVTAIEKYEDVLAKRDRGEGFYDTGCHYLNSRLVEGFAPKNITVVYGPSGVGKSAYVLHLVNKQINKKIPTVYISLEMSMEATLDRLIAQRNSLTARDLRPDTANDMYIQDHVFDKIDKDKIKFAKLENCRFIESPSLTILELEKLLTDIMEEMGVSYLIATVDLMTMLKDFNKSGNTSTDYTYAMDKLHELARKLGIHIVGVAQARRPPEKVAIKEVADVEKFRPRLEDLKNSSAMEERSRIILSVFRPKHFVKRTLPDAPELTIMEDICDIDILKQNAGETGRLHYLFLPESFAFYKWQKPAEEDYQDL